MSNFIRNHFNFEIIYLPKIIKENIVKLETLFSPEKIGNVQIKNRIERSATYEGMALKYGYVSEDLIKLYTELAQGGTGLIITGASVVDPGGAGSPYQTALYHDDYIAGQKRLVDAVHEYSEVKIATQLVHLGRRGTNPKYPVVAPSPVRYKYSDNIPKELPTDDIQKLINMFVSAGRRAYESGYDLVQMHAAHDYMLCNFISPFTNRRNDEYGGDTQERAKILVDIYNQLRDEVGKNFPIIIKLQTDDDVMGGLDLEEAKNITRIIVNAGYDAIEPSASSIESQLGEKNSFPSKRIKTPNEENYFLPTAKELKPLMKNSKLMLMGGIKNPLSAVNLLQEKVTDFISMSRPLIREPNLPNRWKSGDLSPAECISCNSCYVTLLTGSVYCVVKKKLEKRRMRKEKKDE